MNVPDAHAFAKKTGAVKLTELALMEDPRKDERRGGLYSGIIQLNSSSIQLHFCFCSDQNCNKSFNFHSLFIFLFLEVPYLEYR